MADSSIKKKLASIPQIYVKESGYNKHANYKYSTIEDLRRGVKPHLISRNIAYIGFTTGPPETQIISTKKTDTKTGEITESQKVLRCITVRFILFDGDTGDTLEACYLGEGQDIGDKAISKAYTSAEKSFLYQTFQILTGPVNTDKKPEGAALLKEVAVPPKPETPPKKKEQPAPSGPKPLELPPPLVINEDLEDKRERLWNDIKKWCLTKYVDHDGMTLLTLEEQVKTLQEVLTKYKPGGNTE